MEIYTRKKEKDSGKAYLRELCLYKEKLDSYKNNIIENINEWNRMIDEKFSNLYLVDFYIENIGNKSDKNIDVEVQLGSNSYIKNQSLENLYCHPKFLKKPKKPIYSERSGSNFVLPRVNNPIINQSINRYACLNMSMEFKDAPFNVNLSSMRIGDDISIFKEKVLIELPKKEEITVVIKSENSNAKIEKTVEFKIEQEPIEYYDYLKSQLDE